jgi:hypothetical protein
LPVPAISTLAAAAPIIIIVAHTAAMLFRPADRAGCSITGVTPATSLIPSTVVTTAPVFAVPIVALFTPITTVMVTHRVTAPNIVEQVKSISRIPVAVIPAATISDIIKAMPIVALVIAIIAAIGITFIGVVIIAVAGIAQTDIIDTTGQAKAGHSQKREFK